MWFGIVFWFSQVFGLILMLLKNLSFLFKAFDQSGEMDFFSSQVHQFFICLFYIILAIYKEREWLEVTAFLICSTYIVSPANFYMNV